jgi:hypothetical protein
MGNVSLAAAGALILRTYLFVLLRAVVYFGIAAAFVVAAGGGAGIGWGIGTIAGSPSRIPGAFWGAIGGFAFVGLILWWLREYLLYFVEASHGAAMVLALDRTASPGGQGMIPAAMVAMQRHYRNVGVLFSADRLVQGAIGRLIAMPDTHSSLLPSGMSIPRSLSDPVLRNMLGFVGKVALVQPIRSTDREPWPGLQDSLIRLAQNHAILMRHALVLAAAAFGSSLVVFFVALVPASALAQTFPGGSALIAIILAAIFAWAVKQALVEPLVVAAFLDLYVRVVNGQAPDSDWDARMVEASGEFREIKARAFPPARGPRRSPVV